MLRPHIKDVVQIKGVFSCVFEKIQKQTKIYLPGTPLSQGCIYGLPNTQQNHSCEREIKKEIFADVRQSEAFQHMCF